MRPIRYKSWTELYTVDSVTGCWLWTGSHDNNGYGCLNRSYKTWPAHRFVFEHSKGIKIPKNMDLDHLCRVPNCVNPEHLEIVTTAENVHRGNRSVLSWKEVDEIRRKYKEERITQRKLGRLFGVHQGTIWQIVNKVTWK